jgi:hypothetical protein
MFKKITLGNLYRLLYRFSNNEDQKNGMDCMTVCCPKCFSKAFKRNGFTRHGKQNHRCLDCGRQFSLEPEVNYVIEISPHTETANTNVFHEALARESHPKSLD